jgi:phage tail sheath gpL-like
VNFNQIPSTIRTPGSYAEFDASRARPPNTEKPTHALLIGTKLSGGSMTVETVYPLTSGGSQAEALAGVGSPLAEMARYFCNANPEAEVSIIASTEPSGGTLAAGSLAFTGTATADGYVYLYVGGTLVLVRVLSGTTHTAVATAVYNAINLVTRLPIVATNATPGTATLASKWKGVACNDILIELNRNSPVEALPAGIACTVTTMASGAGVPVIATTIAAFGTEWYDRFVTQFNDDATVDALEAEALARWDGTVALDAIVYASYRGAYSDATTYGDARNSPYDTVLTQEYVPEPPWIAAAVYAAVDASETDPARPLNTLVLPGLTPPKKSQRFTRTQRDALLHNGMTTIKVVNEAVTIERAITTYQTNASAVADDTYLDLTTPKTLSYLRWSRNAWLTSKFPRHKLGNPSDNYDPDQPIATVDTIRGEIIAWAQVMARKALIENLDAYVAGLVVERDLTEANPGGDPNRVNIFDPPDLVNGMHVFAGKIGFIV